MALSFTDLDNVVVHVISLVSFLWFMVSFHLPLVDEDKRLVEASYWETLTEGESGYCLDGRGYAQ